MAGNSSAGNRPRQATQINKSLDRSLKAYSTAAAAAGVGLLSLAQPTEAKVVFTPKHQVLFTDQTLSLDLNNDGIADFEIVNRRVGLGTSYGSLVAVDAGPPLSNRILQGNGTGYFAFARVLAAGVTISSRQRFLYDGVRMAYCQGRGGVATQKMGGWASVTDRYLGLKFFISGQPHFGWARFTVRLLANLGCVFRVRLTGYAYETVPNAPIVTGQTTDIADAVLNPPEEALAGLGTLALGAPGLSIWRREESEDNGLQEAAQK